MRIASITITVVAVPDAPLRNVLGCHQPYALRNVIQVHTDDGITGLGEMPGGTQFQSELAAASKSLLGFDPYHVERLRLLFPDKPKIQSAFEVPCLDIIGKATGRSVVDILGGPARDRVHFSAYLFFKFATPDDWLETPRGTPQPVSPLGMSAWREAVLTPEQMVDEAVRFVEQYGFKTLKLKGGVLELRREVETLRLLRHRLGSDYQLRIDPNAGWTVQEALDVLPLLQQIGIEYYEDPVTGLENMAAVAQHASMPLATNMVVTGFSDLPEAAARHGIRVILADHHWWGGLWAIKYLGRICETFGLGLSQHSNTHLGISLAAMLHAAAAVPNLTYASDTHYPWQQGWDIVNERFEFSRDDGSLRVPHLPGLGVTLNEEALSQMAEIAKVVPATHRDDEAVMRRWFPDWIPKQGHATIRGLI